MIEDLANIGLRELEADVVIAGAGPAGITLALELARLRPDLSVVLLEGGGRKAATLRERELYRVDLGARNYLADSSRRRILGGTSAHWGGWSKPYDAADFAPRMDWLLPGWPFGADQLAPYLPAAHAWCEIESDNYDIEALSRRHPGRLLELPAGGFLSHAMFRFSPPTRFGTRYADELEAQSNLRCLLHANVFRLEQNGDRIVAAHARALDGEACRIRAGRFVLAMGGIENTRHLLVLRDEGPQDGVGIHSHHLGRYFSDHFGASPGRFLAPASLSYTRFSDESGPVMPVLVPSEQALAGRDAINCCIALNAKADELALSDAYGGQAALGFKPGEYWHYRVVMICESRPHPDSRIELVPERCELGLQRARIDWRVDERDFSAINRLFLDAGRELSRLGLGRVQLSNPDSSAIRAGITGSYHHMGSTRMSSDPHDGVVDPFGRVFDMDNLYVIGSSTFPRYGYSNPTLTIVALALRLANTLAVEGASA